MIYVMIYVLMYNDTECIMIFNDLELYIYNRHFIWLFVLKWGICHHENRTCDQRLNVEYDRAGPSWDHARLYRSMNVLPIHVFVVVHWEYFVVAGTYMGRFIYIYK